MTRIKLCGLSREDDIIAANALMPDFVGFVFWPKSRRYVSSEKVRSLKKLLSPKIFAVGVFVDEEPEKVSELLNAGIIDIAQLHGQEDEQYISRLRALTDKKIIRAFKITSASDINDAENSTADFVMLDAGKGSGQVFDWSLIAGVNRPYFLAGGLDAGNVAQAVKTLRPYAVDVSSGIETAGQKDFAKMRAFVEAVRGVKIS